MTSPISFSSSDFDPAEVFADALMNQISREDVNNMVKTQRDMLSRFEKTNEMLINFNILSANRCAETSQDFKKHTQILYEMKKDLDTVFKRIRIVKERLGKVYPDAFKSLGGVAPLLEEEEGEEESVASSRSSLSTVKSQSTESTGNQSTDNGQTVSASPRSRLSTAKSQSTESAGNQSTDGQTVSASSAESEKQTQGKTENKSAQASQPSKLKSTGRVVSPSQNVPRNSKTKSDLVKSKRK